MSSRSILAVAGGLFAAVFTSSSAHAGAVPISRESSLRVAIVNDQVNLVDTRQNKTFADFNDTASVFDDVHGSGNAVADQTSKLTIVNGEIRGFDVHGTATAGGPDAEAHGKFDLVFTVPKGQILFLTTGGSGGGGGQSANGIADLEIVETQGPETLQHFRSGEFPVDFGMRALLVNGNYDLTLTYDAGGFSGAQADLSGTFTNAIPLPLAVCSGAATMIALPLFAGRRWMLAPAVGECHRPA